MRPSRRCNLPRRALGAALVAALALPGGAEVTRKSSVFVVAPDGVAGDAFGTSTALDGSTLAVGAPGADGGKGAVYVFDRTTGAFSFTKRLALFDGATGDAFGKSLALQGDVLVVGAPGRELGAGTAVVFTRTISGWIEGARLAVTGGLVAGDGFGTSVSLDDRSLVVGAPGRDAKKAKDSGAAFVFTGQGAVWLQQATLLAKKPQKGDAAGTAVAVRDDVAVVGAPGHDLKKSRPDVGAAFLFTRSGAAWQGGDALKAKGLLGYKDGLGTSVAIDGDTIAVGAPFTVRYRYGANASGAVYVFRRSGATATQEGELFYGSTLGDNRGTSVALDGDRLFSGAPHSQFMPGYVHSWLRSGSAWSRVAFLDDLPAQTGDATTALGTSVAVSGNLVAAGGPDFHAKLGVVFLFESRPPVVSSGPTATPPSPRVLDEVTFTAGATDPDGDTLTSAWTFDDGGVATTAQAKHVFRTPGAHAGRFLAGDGIAAAVAQADVTVLASTNPVTAISMSEKLSSKPVTVRDSEEGGVSHERADFGSFHLAGTVDLTGVDVAGFTATTEFHLALGGFEVRVKLGDDPAWTPGKTSARFDATELLGDEGHEHTFLYRRIDADWSAGRLTFVIEDTTSNGLDRDFDRSIVASKHLFAPTASVTGEIVGALVFGPATTSFRLPYAGKVKSSGSETGETYTLRSSVTTASTGFQSL